LYIKKQKKLISYFNIEFIFFQAVKTSAQTTKPSEIVKNDNCAKTENTCKATQKKKEVSQPTVVKKPETRSSTKELV